MNIHPVDKTTLRAKQMAPRILIDGVQIRANRTALTAKGREKFKIARNFDYNVQGPMADVEGSLGINNR
jgi:hypothetical protein